MEKIKLILNNPELKEKMQNNVKAYIGMLSWETLADIYFQDIEMLAAKNPQNNFET